MHTTIFDFHNIQQQRASNDNIFMSCTCFSQQTKLLLFESFFFLFARICVHIVSIAIRNGLCDQPREKINSINASSTMYSISVLWHIYGIASLLDCCCINIKLILIGIRMRKWSTTHSFYYTRANTQIPIEQIFGKGRADGSQREGTKESGR